MFRLAAHLGMTVGELGARMTSAEISEWIAYDKVEGIFDPQWSAAMIAFSITRALGSKATFDTFLPPGRGPVQSSADHKAIMGAFRESHNARIEHQS